MAIRSYADSDDEADDMLQDCWVQILEELDSYGQRGPFAAWAMAVSKNFCKTRARAEKRVSVSEITLGHMGQMPGNPDELPWPAEQGRQQLWKQVVHDALARLPDRERDVIVLRLLKGRDTAETALTLGVSESGVRSILLRAMSRLRRMKGLREVLPEWIEGD